MKKIVIIGEMDNTKDHTFESANRVYSARKCMPTLPTSCGGGHTPKVIKRVNISHVNNMRYMHNLQEGEYKIGER